MKRLLLSVTVSLLLLSTFPCLATPLAKDRIKKHTHESMTAWSPYKVSDECPIYVYCQSIDKGFGDKMVWYIYCMNVAKIFEGALLVDPDMWQAVSEDWEGQPHKDSEQYYNIAKDIFGIKFQPGTKRFIEELVLERKFSKQIWKFREIFDYFEGIRRNGTAFHPIRCNTIIESYVGSCAGSDCTMAVSKYQFIDSVKWVLRSSSNVRRNCELKNLGFKYDDKMINVMWHIRTGDLCLHCKDPNYVADVYDYLVELVGLKKKDVKEFMNTFIESSYALSELSDNTVGMHLKFTQNKLEESICKFVTSDVYIGSGSSLSSILAFAEENSPIIMEDRRKVLKRWGDSELQQFEQNYFFSNAIHINEGKPLQSDNEMRRLVQTILKRKGKLVLYEDGIPFRLQSPYQRETLQT